MMEVREQRDDLLRRLPGMRLGFLLVLVVIASFYWLVQVVHGSNYRERAENNRLRKAPVRAARGLIFDREDRLLAENVPSYDLLLDQSRAQNLDKSLEFAAKALQKPIDELRAVLERAEGRSPFRPVLMAENLSLSQVARFSVETLEHPEFEIEVGHLRLYRHGPITAHLLGYLGEATENELGGSESTIRVGDLVGRRGLEKNRDRELRGEDGERVFVVDSRGRLRDEHGKREASPGSDLRLTLDLELQQEATRYFENRVGAAVALDPRDGAIRAFVSSPSYDPNSFARRLAQSEWREILDAPNNPLQNRVIQNAHSPGSIFKIVVATAGLTENEVSTSDRFYCPGYTKIYNRRFRCWKSAGHGWVNIHEAIQFSCDVYFYHLGQKLGIEKIARYARLFGLGRPTGLDLVGEREGLVPDPAWSLAKRKTKWYPGETISVAIGQGPLLVTPLQLASLMATVANGGFRVTPHLIQGMEHKREKVALDERALTIVRRALWAVVNDKGTGAIARTPALEIAGKTGTVQVVEQKTWVDSSELPFDKRDHAWFLSYGPAENAELVVAVFVEHGGKGSVEAAPLAKILYEKYFSTLADSVS